MATRELDILVRAKGAIQAAQQIGKVDSSIGRLSSHAARGVRSATTNIARIGVVAAGAVASQVVFGVRSLEELERANNATAGVIESTGGKAGVTAQQVRDLAESLESVTTADDKVIQSGENLLLTFTNIGKDVFPQATKSMVDLGIAMAQGDVENADFKSSAIQIGKALNDPIRGITALRRVGVSFTKQQEKQIKTLAESGDVAGAQKIILQELETEFGKAGEAAGQGFGADMRRFGDAVEGAQQALATGFLPLIKEVSSFLTAELAKPETIAAIKDFGVGLAGGLRQAISLAKSLPWDTIGSSLKIAGAGAKAVLDAFLAMPPWVQGAVISGWGLNKLTGGALGSIVGELGKGLIKGVLGMSAGVVNINAGVVNGAGGGGVGGKAGLAGLGAVGAIGVAGVATAVIAGSIDAANIAKGVGEGYQAYQQKDLQGVLDAQRNTFNSLLTLPPYLKGIAEIFMNEQQKQVDAVDAAREKQVTKVESMKGAMVQATQRAADKSTNAAERTKSAMVSATTAGDNRIVSAIRGIRMNVNLTIPITVAADRRAIVRAQTGTTLSKAGHFQPGGETA